jgi:hypothetical protein
MKEDAGTRSLNEASVLPHDTTGYSSLMLFFLETILETICLTIRFTICLFVTGSPDLDGHRYDIYHIQGTKINHDTVCLMCFTICLFISPDLDGHRAPKNRA